MRNTGSEPGERCFYTIVRSSGCESRWPPNTCAALGPDAGSAPYTGGVSFHPKGEGGADPGPMQIEIPGKTALLLVRLAQELGAQTPGEVVMQAVGVLQTIRQAKAGGRRIILRDPTSGHEVDLAL